MADISAFPTISNPLYTGSNTITLTASGTIKAGQVVAFDATGVSKTVRAANAESGERPVGVAIHDAADGEPVTVATVGCICYVANADDSTAIDAGDWLETNDNSVGGTVSAVDTSATGGATVTVHDNVVGFAFEDIPGGGTGLAMILPGIHVQPNSS